MILFYNTFCKGSERGETIRPIDYKAHLHILIQYNVLLTMSQHFIPSDVHELQGILKIQNVK